MNTVNQVLITLVEADQLACAENPHHQRLALVLLDNIVELQLRRKAEGTFLLDRTTWYSGVRKHSRKKRKLVSRDFAQLLSLAVEETWITPHDSRLLAYVHRVRNRVFHEGWPEDSSDLRLSLTLLYRFVHRYFPIWRSCEFGLMITRESPISMRDAKSDPSGRAPLRFGFEDDDYEASQDLCHGFDSQTHWSRVIESCVNFDHAGDVRPLIKQRIVNLVDRLQQSIDYLTESDRTDFNAVLAQRFSIMTPCFSELEFRGEVMRDPIAALNIYLGVLDSEERLLDIVDPSERAAEFHKILNTHEFRGDLFSSLRLDEYRGMASRVTSQTESAGISQFLEIEQELEAVAWAVSECASDLDCYEQWLLDCARGK